jgi:hypothetical protein
MAMDSVRIIFDHIIKSKISGKNSLDLFLSSNGGDGTVPWKLVTLIREYFTKFSVLVPCRAFSAATLIALGADEIIMHPMGMLGPTDPNVANDFNPPNPVNPQQKLGISVEDVTAYINLIKEDVGISKGNELVEAFNKLPNVIHPLALGNVKRSLAQSRMMATKILSLHMKNPKDRRQINMIVDNLTSKLYYHGHPINRDEASKQLGIKTIINETSEIEDLIWQLYLEYENEMKLSIPFEPLYELLQKKPDLKLNISEKTAKETLKLVYIESEYQTDVNELDYEILGTLLPNSVTNAQLLTLYEGWRTE